MEDRPRPAKEGPIEGLKRQGRNDMGEQQHAHVGALGDRGRLLGGGVVGEDVVQDGREIGAAVGQRGAALDGHEIGREALVNQQIGAPGHGLQTRRGGRVAADHHPAALVDEEITHRRVHRTMVHGKGDHLQVRVIDQGHIRSALADREGAGRAAEAGGRHDLHPVVCDPVALVERVGLLEARDDLAHARGPPNRQR